MQPVKMLHGGPPRSETWDPFLQSATVFPKMADLFKQVKMLRLLLF